MIEYILVAVMLIACLSVMHLFLSSFKEYGGRVIDLAASEYP